MVKKAEGSPLELSETHLKEQQPENIKRPPEDMPVLPSELDEFNQSESYKKVLGELGKEQQKPGFPLKNNLQAFDHFQESQHRKDLFWKNAVHTPREVVRNINGTETKITTLESLDYDPNIPKHRQKKALIIAARQEADYNGALNAIDSKIAVPLSYEHAIRYRRAGTIEEVRDLINEHGPLDFLSIDAHGDPSTIGLNSGDWGQKDNSISLKHWQEHEAILKEAEKNIKPNASIFLLACSTASYKTDSDEKKLADKLAEIFPKRSVIASTQVFHDSDVTIPKIDVSEMKLRHYLTGRSTGHLAQVRDPTQVVPEKSVLESAPKGVDGKIAKDAYFDFEKGQWIQRRLLQNGEAEERIFSESGSNDWKKVDLDKSLANQVQFIENYYHIYASDKSYDSRVAYFMQSLRNKEDNDGNKILTIDNFNSQAKNIAKEVPGLADKVMKAEFRITPEMITPMSHVPVDFHSFGNILDNCSTFPNLHEISVDNFKGIMKGGMVSTAVQIAGYGPRGNFRGYFDFKKKLPLLSEIKISGNLTPDDVIKLKALQDHLDQIYGKRHTTITNNGTSIDEIHAKLISNPKPSAPSFDDE